MAEFANHDAYVDTLLTEMSIAYRNPLYIASDVFTMLPVNRQTGIVPRYNQSDWFRNLASARGTAARSNRGSFGLDNTMLYSCKWASFGVDIPDIVRDNQMNPYDLDRDATEFATDKVRMEQELNFVTTAFTTGVWTGDQTGVAAAPAANQFIQWNNYATSTPLVDFTNFMDNVEARTGQEANVATMGKQVWNILKWHPTILDTIKYTQTAVVGAELFASLVNLRKINVGRAIYTTAADGTAEGSVTYSRIWGKHVLFSNTPETPRLMTPAAGYTVAWQRVASPLGYIKRMRDEQAEIDIIECNAFYEHKVTAPNSGLFCNGAVA